MSVSKKHEKPKGPSTAGTRVKPRPKRTPRPVDRPANRNRPTPKRDRVPLSQRWESLRDWAQGIPQRIPETTHGVEVMLGALVLPLLAWAAYGALGIMVDAGGGPMFGTLAAATLAVYSFGRLGVCPSQQCECLHAPESDSL